MPRLPDPNSVYPIDFVFGSSFCWGSVKAERDFLTEDVMSQLKLCSNSQRRINEVSPVAMFSRLCFTNLNSDGCNLQMSILDVVPWWQIKEAARAASLFLAGKLSNCSCHSLTIVHNKRQLFTCDQKQLIVHLSFKQKLWRSANGDQRL